LRGARFHRLSSFSWTRDESYQGTDVRCDEKTLPLFEIASVLVRLDHVARRIVNANHGIMLAAAMLRVAGCVVDCVWLAIPQRELS
jgi:hypothetical protein